MKRKYSKQREVILSAVMNNKKHPTAEDIYTFVKSSNPNISLGTVYRNLKLLADDGSINRIKSNAKNEHYDSRLDNHIHMLCNDCFRIFDVHCNPSNLINMSAILETSHAVTDINITLSGVCNNCRHTTNFKEETHHES